MKKLGDPDFLEVIRKYDIVFATETWCNKYSNIAIDGYVTFSCPRPKSCNEQGEVVAVLSFIANIICLVE